MILNLQIQYDQIVLSTAKTSKNQCHLKILRNLVPCFMYMISHYDVKYTRQGVNMFVSEI